MARYLISLEKEDNYPKFLTHSKVGGNQQNDPLGHNALMPGINVGEVGYVARETPVEVEIKGKDGQDLTFKILETETWPDADQLGLDSSQYRALQAALTKELVVIQGPPGTGKTFMALKIAEFLVKNKERMGRSTPILVVCLTNHALDQFLVGMMSFTQKIVRIGGQSKREELTDKNLKNLAHERRSAEQQSLIWEHRNMLDNLNRRQDEVERSLYAVENGLMSKEGFVLSGIEVNELYFEHELLGGDRLAWFLGGEKGYYVTFEKLRADIEVWKKEEISYIYSEEELNKVEAASLELEVHQYAYYLQAEVNFLESHFCSFEHKGVQAPSKSRKSKRRTFEMSMDEKLSRYFQDLEVARKGLLEKRFKLVENAMKATQILEELRYMEQIKLLEGQDVIGLTTTGAARLHKMLSTVGCQIGGLITLVD
jgi:anthranilate/para-aminobenzoate synthase component II